MATITREKYMDEIEIKLLRSTAETRALQDERAKRAGGIHGWMLIDLALGTGFRVSELAKLRIEDIDFERKFVKVERVKRKKKTKEVFGVSDELLKHLRDYIDWTGRSKGPLLVGARGPLSSQGLQQIWKRAVKLAGLPKSLSIHSARHTLAVHVLKKTKNLRLVQKMLGHSSPNTTAAFYADVPFAEMRDALNGLYDDPEVDNE